MTDLFGICTDRKKDIENLTEIISKIPPSLSNFENVQILSDAENVKVNWEKLGDELSRSTDSRKRAETVMPRMLYLLERIQDSENCVEMTKEWLIVAEAYHKIHNLIKWSSNYRSASEIRTLEAEVEQQQEKFYTSMYILDKTLELGLRPTLAMEEPF